MHSEHGAPVPPTATAAHPPYTLGYLHVHCSTRASP